MSGMGDKKINEKSDRAQARAAKQGDIFASRRGAQIADWHNADSEKLKKVVALVGAEQHAIMFGYTSDGGAYVIRIYRDGDITKKYVTPSEDINEVLDDIIGYYED